MKMATCDDDQVLYVEKKKEKKQNPMEIMANV